MSETREEIKTELLQLRLNSKRRLERNVLADPDHTGVYHLVGSIGEKSVHILMSAMDSFRRRHPGAPITIILNSGGGSVLDGLALIDYIKLLRKEGVRVKIVGVGAVMSMASAILMAADERVMTPHCWLGLHEVSSMVQGTITAQEDQMKFSQGLQKQIVGLLTERSTLTPKQLDSRWRRKDVFMDANEALKLGFIDRIEEV